jgi:hypothetical protein
MDSFTVEHIAQFFISRAKLMIFVSHLAYITTSLETPRLLAHTLQVRLTEISLWPSRPITFESNI